METSRKLTHILMTLLALVVLASSALAADPGIAYPVEAEASDDKAGSVLFFNAYTSSVAANTSNTRINITNTSTTAGVVMHMFFVDGATCSVADFFLCLTANQTASLLTSDIDPNVSGYIVAVAVDGPEPFAGGTGTGAPVRHNFVIGDEYIKYSTGHYANLGAEAFAKLTDANVLSTDGTLTALFFDGLLLAGSYNRAARVVALDNIPSRADGNDTLLILNRVGGNFTVSAATLGTLFGLLYDDAENALSFSITGGCQFRNSLSNNVPRTVPRFETVIPSGRSGWMKIFSQSDIAIIGAQLNFNPNAGASDAFNGGHNLHKLRLSAAANLVLPVIPPSC